MGPTVLRLISPNGDSIAPILFNVDAQPPVIQAMYDQVDSIHLAFIDAQHPAATGNVLMLDAANLFGSTPPVPASSVHISVGGVGSDCATSVKSVLQFGLISNVTRIQFTLASGLPASTSEDAAQQPVTVRVAPFVLGTLYAVRYPASAGP